MHDDFENDLVQRAGRGDPTAAPFLISYLGDHLLGYARAVAVDLGDTDRERIVELAVEAGVRSIDRFDPARGSLRQWFRQQVRWKVAEWRRSGPAPGLELPPEPFVAPENAALLPPSIADAVRTAIAELTPDDRLVLALRLVEGLEHSEIAQRLAVSNDTARQRYRRARERLRSRMERIPALVAYLKERGAL